MADSVEESIGKLEEQEECLKFIIGESNRLSNISSAILSMARLKNEEELEMKIFSLRDMCQKLENLYTRELKEKGILFSIDGLVGKINDAVLEKEEGDRIDSRTYEMKEVLYEQYYEQSRYMIEDILKLSPIKDEVPDLNRKKYFEENSELSIISLGYTLEDKTHIQIFYNNENQLLDGFMIE